MSVELPFFSVSPGGLLLATACGFVLVTVGQSGATLIGPGLTIPDDRRGSLSTLLTTVIADECRCGGREGSVEGEGVVR